MPPAIKETRWAFTGSQSPSYDAPMVQVAVLTAARREKVAEKTLWEIHNRGRAWVFPQKVVLYSAPLDRKPPVTPLGWRVVHQYGPRGGGADFRALVRLLDPTMDALVFEDDVQPCRNALLAMYGAKVPDDCAFLSFYDIGGRYTKRSYHGIVRADPADGWWGNQALRLPWWVIRDFNNGRYEACFSNAQDTWLGNIARDRRLSIGVSAPSLVQHVGEDSLCNPGAGLTGIRGPSPMFPGQDFDALTGRPLEWKPDHADSRERITWCEFHGTHHENATTCPMIETCGHK